MLDILSISPADLKALSPSEWSEAAAQILALIAEQNKRIDTQEKGIKWRDAKIESVVFELARLKAWRFGAKTERMNAEQREIFEETFAADHASLEAELAALNAQACDAAKADAPSVGASEDKKRRQPKRESLPNHLPRVDQRIERQDTHCPSPDCRQPMQRIGEDVSERLDIVPAQFCRRPPSPRLAPHLPYGGQRRPVAEARHSLSSGVAPRR